MRVQISSRYGHAAGVGTVRGSLHRSRVMGTHVTRYHQEGTQSIPQMRINNIQTIGYVASLVEEQFRVLRQHFPSRSYDDFYGGFGRNLPQVTTSLQSPPRTFNFPSGTQAEAATGVGPRALS
jgi:hypothetical protein